MQRTLMVLAAGLTLCFGASLLLLLRVGYDCISLPCLLVISVADAMLMMSPLVFLPPKWRWVSVLPVAFFPLLMWANSIYALNCGTPIPAFSYFHNTGAWSFIVDSTLASMGAADLILLLSVAVVVGLIACSHKAMSAERRFGKAQKVMYVAAYLVVFSAVSVLGMRRYVKWHTGSTWRDALENYCSTWSCDAFLEAHLTECGMANYMSAMIVRLTAARPHIGDAEEERIREFFSGKGSVSDNVLAENRSKNLILLIVESLNSWALEPDCAEAIAPVLVEPTKDSTVICALDIVPNIGPGRSSDGQLVYNTGLLPLRTEAFAIRFPDSDFPSLAKALAYETAVEVIGEGAMLYNHGVTSDSYGYTALYDNIATGEPIMQADSLILLKACDVIRDLPQPFFMEITTLSMHQPYNKPDDEAVISLPDSFHPEQRAYAHALNRFDRALGRLLSELKASGIYDDTVIVIASDHDEKVPGIDESAGAGRIAALILNSGVGMRIHEERQQADLFPTILDVMGIVRYEPAKLQMPYRGMGTSFFRPAVPVTEHDWAMSELLIGGLYFVK